MIYLLITSLLWGLSFGLTKNLLGSVDPSHVIIIRLFFALIVFLPFLRFKLFSSKIGLRLFCIGMVQQGAAYVFYIEALSRLYSYEVAFFLVFLPIYVSVFLDVYQRKLNFNVLALGSLVIVGSAIIYPLSTFRPEALVGFILMQLCNVCFALGQVEYKRLQAKLPQIEEHYYFPYMYSGGLMLTLIVLGLRGSGLNISYISYSSYFNLFLLGSVSTGLGFFLWNKGIAKVRNSRVVLMNNIKIPVGVFCSILIFGESASIAQLVIGSSFFVLAFILERRMFTSPRLVAA